jgi:hypothetical protein
MAEVIYKDESYRIMGACFEVYKEMGCGFLEPVYQECLEFEFQDRSIVFQPQLHATGYKLGLLVNFGFHPKVKSERIVL